MQFDYLIFIGRFQPFHLGHEFVMTQAFSYTNHLIVLIGSANLPRTLKNPFSFDERASMIQKGMAHIVSSDKHLSCVAVDDAFDDVKWVQNVKNAIASIIHKGASIGIIGHNKDESTYYLQLFPQWQFVEVSNFHNLSATPLRDAYFGKGAIDDTAMPPPTVDFLAEFKHSAHYETLAADYQHIVKFQQDWQHAPYPPVFVTADAVVVYANHVLMIERTGYGAGLFALPGGFLDKNEQLLECAIRELKEETSLDLALDDAKNALAASAIFDAPKRSARGRFITHAFLFDVTQLFDTLPSVRGQDDAKRAFWCKLDELIPNNMFEDHYQIITKLLQLRQHPC